MAWKTVVFRSIAYLHPATPGYEGNGDVHAK